MIWSFFFLQIIRLKTRPQLKKKKKRTTKSFYLKGEKNTFLSRIWNFPASIPTRGFTPACESEPRNFRGGESNLKPHRAFVVMEGCSKQKLVKKKMSWGFCALPNQFIPVHQRSLLFAAACPRRWQDTDAHATQRRLQNLLILLPLPLTPLRPLRSLASTGCLSSHSTLEPSLRAALCEFIHLPHRSRWCHSRLVSMFPPSFILRLFGRAYCTTVHSSSPLTTCYFPWLILCTFSTYIFFLNFMLFIHL